FADQDVAQGASAPQTFIIANRGTVGILHINSLFLSGTDASHFLLLGNTNVSSLTPGSTRAISLSFQPRSAGFKLAVLKVLSDDSDEGGLELSLNGRAFDLNPCTAPNPVNTVAQNSSTNAQLVCPNFVFTGTTFEATADGASTCESGGPDV